MNLAIRDAQCSRHLDNSESSLLKYSFTTVATLTYRLHLIRISISCMYEKPLALLYSVDKRKRRNQSISINLASHFVRHHCVILYIERLSTTELTSLHRVSERTQTLSPATRVSIITEFSQIPGRMTGSPTVCP